MKIDPRDPRSAGEQERSQRSLPFQREKDQIERGRHLRREMTKPERILWSRLKGGHLNGLKFRRQHPVGPYTADFYCHEALLVVECDGAVHNQHLCRDAARDAWFDRRGIRTVRVSASLVTLNAGTAVAMIAKAADEAMKER